eukprot:CAMPEP_0201571552 /NCGR_PEP_ID=MMETSP0190_2-20130828/14403_1 /ASSEMBLY_ACC=CAM_ASM_000263 /TAXON_ID=37353 /ORGANISM="Rosalina sp." /LENGTH=49 /DNA_ID=CAMNT_0047996339 /DNA_START=1 /DNA_END=150 /DNA_ORIENTATION=-
MDEDLKEKEKENEGNKIEDIRSITSDSTTDQKPTTPNANTKTKKEEIFR